MRIIIWNVLKIQNISKDEHWERYHGTLYGQTCPRCMGTKIRKKGKRYFSRKEIGGWFSKERYKCTECNHVFTEFPIGIGKELILEDIMGFIGEILDGQKTEELEQSYYCSRATIADWKKRIRIALKKAVEKYSENPMEDYEIKCYQGYRECSNYRECGHHLSDRERYVYSILVLLVLSRYGHLDKNNE